MPVKYSPPAKNKISQINKAFPAPTAKVPLDHTQSVHQLSGYRGISQGAGRIFREAEYQEVEVSVEEEDYWDSEVEASPETPESPNIPIFDTIFVFEEEKQTSWNHGA
ncbi:hypothetical protein O181_031742 [Austropuccinia psidii MF-1]|uniref:Uncharacterized protein n=1 Tax=Austropuccinia psidii MF-1 TaxID=1389203 RepID=A0A9Q3H5M4_9BASI|nr:hypothetical protein [Austropuccinia psidii MF-1]